MFNRKRGNFEKLIEKCFENTRIIESLDITIFWDKKTQASPREPIKIINAFNSNEVTKELLIYHCNLVWDNTTYGTDTAEYFQKFTSFPVGNTELNKARNTRKLKHVMTGDKSWNSVTSDFKIEVSGETGEFKKKNEYNGPLMWEYIRRRVNLSTMVRASRLK